MELTVVNFEATAPAEQFSLDITSDSNAFGTKSFRPDALEIASTDTLESFRPDALEIASTDTLEALILRQTIAFEDLAKEFDAGTPDIDPETGMLINSDIETVIGDDDREKVTETNKWPFSPNGRVLTQFPKGLGNGSGVLVSPYHVLTCGHNCSVNKYGGLISKFSFYPGASEGITDFGSATASRLFIAKKWFEEEDRNYDIALIELDKPIGLNAGYFGMVALTDNNLVAQKVTVLGYPGDKDNGKNQYKHSDNIQSTSESRINYLIDTAAGQSGSAVLLSNSISLAVTIGVHTTGHFKSNGATRITRDIIETFLNVMTQRK
jgi:V8-like Glu-specific endopeptidase